MSGAGFVNLHNHSHYSILDGYSRPVEYLKQAAALGQTALALTDHGNLFGAFEFVSAARAMSKSLDKKKHPQEPVWVKPIVGIEAYMAPENPEGARCKKPVFYSDDPSKRSIDVSSNGAYTHLTLLAVDDEGFHNLIRLSTESFKRENTYYNQRMDMSMLAKWNTGLVATTGCPSGEIQTRLRLGQVKEAYEYAERMSDLFPGRYYVEIMSHAMKKDLERDAIPQLLKLAEDLKLPLLATNDAHYASPGDARRHEEMLCINTNSRGGAGERVYMDTPTEDTVDEWMETHQKEAQDYLSRGRRVPTRFAFSGNDYYLKSYEEMIRQFPEDKFPGAVRNTLEVADMVGDWWAKKPLDLEAIADKYKDDVELAKAGKTFDADYRLPHAGGGVSVGEPVKANKGVTVLGETPSQPAEFKSDPLTQKLIDDGTVALGPYDLSLNKGIRPVIQIPEGWTEDQWFRKKLNDGFVQRRVAKGDSPEILAESKRRLDVEYPVFEGNDFVQYMLVVADYIGWAREHGVTVGSGRGSVGGSEVAYLMDISRTDPIRHDLLFERFLNPERKSPPDVDTDFKASVRNDVLQYAKDKYGYSNVANIVNFGTFKLKQAFQDIAKIYHADSAQAIKMSKMIPDPIDHGEPTMEDLYDPASPFYPLAGDFREAIEAGGEQWKPIREAAGALVGRVRQTGTHACGVIMCSEPIVNYAPLFWNKNEERAKENIWTDCMCQWKYQDLEAIGLIKMDFLPLSTLDIVDSVIDNVEQYNEQIDVAASAASGAGDADRAAEYRKRKLEVPDFTDIENDGMSDQETYAMLARGESDAVFQMGSDGQKDLLKRIRPTEFSDLVAINALYRPGPMAMNAHLQYADRKNGKEPCYVINEELDKVFKETPMEDILRPTYGLCVPGDEKVLDATTGLHVPIRDFEVGHKTKSWNEETGEWSANVVSDLVHTGTKDCVELTVSNHRKVRVSKTHPLLTPRGWVAAGDLTVGDELAMNDVAMPEIEDKSGLTPDLAWFVGVMLGDGTIPGSKGYPYVTTTDQVIIDELARIAEENFGNIEVTGTKPEDAGGVNGNVYHVMFTNADRRPVGKYDRHAVGYCGDRNTVNQFLARYGYKGKIRMYDKVVTPEVMRGSNEIIRNVVAGMWDTDGTCSKTGLHYTTTSRGLYEGMCQMLDRLGVRVRVSEAPYHNEKRADRVAYRVYPNAEAFRREIVDRLRLKKTAFLSNCVMDHEPAKSMERRPSRFQQEVIEAARELVRNDPSVLSGVDVTDPRIAKNLSLRTLWSAFTGRSFKEYPAKTIAFKQLANSVKNLLPHSLQAKLDTPWRQITAIRSIGEMDCYDITVENDHTFLLNGVISHNCVYQEQIMQISQAMAGYTKGEADSLRKAMGHKVKSEMIANHKMFVDGAMKTAKEKGYGYTKEDVEKLWDIIDQFSAYAFNKCLLYSTKVLLPDNNKITLRDLHKKWQAGDHEIEIMSMWPDGQIRPNKIVNVERMPEKLMTYTVTVEIPKRYRDRKRSFTTRQITMTSNHRMLTTDGYHTIDDGGIHVGSILINDPLWRSRDTAERNAIRRDTARKSIGAYARSEEGREMAREWLTRYQAGLTFEDRSAHQKAVQRLHPDRTDASVKAMYEAHAKAKQEGRSFGYGIMTPLSDGRLCDSINEAMAGEYLLSRGVDFQLHKSLRNDRGQLKFCDFYADGLYFEMDGMGRGEQYFRDNKYGDVPFVYMTPGDYKDKIDEALMNHHIENGVEVISIEPYHKNEVYDVEMADSGPSNFIANGLVSHNSHSVSYAINAYETAYLKCHYKPFFWAANLTQNMKNKDKFRKFLRSARDMGLKVESVDANRSGVGVTAAFDPGKAATDTITFGFDTASGVNETVAREIVASRNKNGGSFKSFDDFMTHGPESILSAGAITGLADAGAFDCLGVMRKQVADRARWIVDFYKKKRSAVASSSRGLLGMLGGSGSKSTEKSMGEYDLTRDEYSKKDGTISFGPLSYDWATMLAKEKASLGVYASADPLSNAGYGLEVMKKNPSSPYRAISTLEEEARTAQDNAGSSDGSNGGGWRRKATTVRLIGYLVDLVVKRNAKGSVWFSGSVCDESGSIEFRMYSRAIQQRMEETGIGDPKTVISEDTVYDMMCSWSADAGRLTIDAVSEVPIAKADGAVPIIIRMKGEGSLRSAKWRDVAALLSAHPGNVPVAVDLAQASGKVELDGRPARRGVNMLGARVDGSSEFMDGLTALVGDRLCSWSSKGRWDPEY